jgi:hypothetical protein
MGTLSGSGAINAESLELNALATYTLASTATPVDNGFSLVLGVNGSIGYVHCHVT